MSNRNTDAAKRNSAFYDTFWNQFGTRPGMQERARMNLLTGGLREFWRGAKANVLDLGCGRGWMSPYLSEFGRVYGVDFSERGISYANEHFSEFGEFFVHGQCADLSDLPLPRKFDIVLSSEVIEHTPDQLNFVTGIRGFLKDGGLCAISTPNGRLFDEFRANPQLGETLQPVENWLTPSELRTLLRANQLKILRHVGKPFARFRLGSMKWLQSWGAERVFRAVAMEPLYGRLVLPFALYQIVIARAV